MGLSNLTNFFLVTIGGWIFSIYGRVIKFGTSKPGRPKTASPTGVYILPLIHKCFPYQPFKNQVILPQFSSMLPLNNQPHTIVLYLFLNVFIVFTLQNILLTWFYGLGVCSGKNLWSLAYFSWVSPGSVCRSPTFDGKINGNSSLASNFQEFFPYQSRGKWKFIYPCD